MPVKLSKVITLNGLFCAKITIRQQVVLTKQSDWSTRQKHDNTPRRAQMKNASSLKILLRHSLEL